MAERDVNEEVSRLVTHAVALLLGVYNFVRKHATLNTTPAVAAGLEEKPWSLERVVAMTEAYWQSKLLMAKKEKQWQRKLAEGAMFQEALAKKP